MYKASSLFAAADQARDSADWNMAGSTIPPDTEQCAAFSALT